MAAYGDVVEMTAAKPCKRVAMHQRRENIHRYRIGVRAAVVIGRDDIEALDDRIEVDVFDVVAVEPVAEIAVQQGTQRGIRLIAAVAFLESGAEVVAQQIELEVLYPAMADIFKDVEIQRCGSTGA